MQLDQMSAHIRNRTAWEGVDLGFAMARQWFWPLWRLWWLTALPVVLLSSLLLRESPLWAATLVWWLKPLYEPLLLFWLSRRLFGETLLLRETLGQWRRMLLPRLLANLTLRRFSANRSFYMPVAHLEGLRGAERVKRLGVLAGNSSAGIWLTIVGAHIEMALCYSLVLLGFYLIPDELLQDSVWKMWQHEDAVLLWLGNGAWFLAMSIFAPFYVAGGFALYLTRRSQLEAWDLELMFRRIAPRLKVVQSTIPVLLAAVTVTLLALPAAPARAAESDPLTREQAQQLITQVLAEEDFGRKESETYWKYVGKSEPAQSGEPPDWDLSWLPQLAQSIEWLLWIGAALLIGWLLIYLARFARYKPLSKTETAYRAPSVLFGLPVHPESLPHDIVAAVQALLAEQRVRAALSLLYRATLVQLIHAHHLRIPDSATEGECQRLVTSSRPEEEAGFFTQLTRAWICCAYGDRPPAHAEILALTGEWQRLYGAPADA